MGLNVTLSASKFVVEPDVRYGLTWEQLVELIGGHQAYPDKERDVPMFSPAQWMLGRTVGKEGVVAIHFGVIDLDDTPEDKLVELLANLECAYLFVTSWSHGSTEASKLFEKATKRKWKEATDDERASFEADAKTRTRGRLVFPFTRPAVPSEWPVLWDVLNEKITNGLGDTKTKDASRRYWFPSHPADPKKAPARILHAGPPVDIDALLGDRAARGTWNTDGATGDDAVGASGGLEVTREQLRTLAKRLHGSSTAARKVLGSALFAVIKGEEFAESGDRNDTLFKLVCEIVDRHPLADAGKIADHFVPSLSVMDTKNTRDDIVNMVERKQSGARQAHAQRIKEALGEGRVDPYTNTELEGFVDDLNISSSALRHQWIIQRGKTFYVFSNGDYRVYSKDDINGGVLRDLAPAITAGVDLFEITQKGLRQKTPIELVRDYGSVASGGVIVDMMAKRARYDEPSKAFVEAPCPLRRITAQYHAPIERWLTLIAGAKADRLRYWLASLPRLDEPCAALYLEGAPRTGKTLLACGAARLWTTERPTELDEALGTFNEALAKCPLVFGDEAVPTDARGKLRTEAIREFVQARVRPLKRKFMPNATLKGCIRLVLAANNKGLLHTTDNLTEHDIEALVERFFYLPVNPEAAAYLADVGPLETKRWLEEDMITEHIHWLYENVDVPRTGRFLVSGEASDLAADLATSTGLRASVCQWLVGYLNNPKKFQATMLRDLVRVNAGRYLVNVRALAEAWDSYVDDDLRRPKPTPISKALAGLSTEVTMRTEKGNAKYRSIRLDLLVEWAETIGYSDAEKISAALADLDETRVAAKASN